MEQKIQTAKIPNDQPRSQIPMRHLDDKEMRQVAGGPIICSTLSPKK
jgi:hypothetical protein